MQYLVVCARGEERYDVDARDMDPKMDTCHDGHGTFQARCDMGLVEATRLALDWGRECGMPVLVSDDGGAVVIAENGHAATDDAVRHAIGLLSLRSEHVCS